MKFNIALWLSLAIFTVHNIEEYFTMSGFLSTHHNEIPVVLANIAKPIPNGTFIIMIILITLAAAGFIYTGVKGGANSRRMFWAMTWIMGGILANGLHHLAITFYFGTYTPGVITSLVLFIPYSIFVWQKSLSEKQLNGERLLWSFAVGAIAIVPIILIIRGVVEQII